jgi:hypothetical protein
VIHALKGATHEKEMVSAARVKADAAGKKVKPAQNQNNIAT